MSFAWVLEGSCLFRGLWKGPQDSPRPLLGFWNSWQDDTRLLLGFRKFQFDKLCKQKAHLLLDWRLFHSWRDQPRVRGSAVCCESRKFTFSETSKTIATDTYFAVFRSRS